MGSALARVSLYAVLAAGSLLLLVWLSLRRAARIYWYLNGALYAAGIDKLIPAVCYTTLTSRTMNTLGADKSRGTGARGVERVVEIVVAWVRDSRDINEDASYRYVIDCLRQTNVPLGGSPSGKPL